jgi:hypothetical protein
MGRDSAAREIGRRGFTVREVREGKMRLFEVASQSGVSPLRLRVKTRQKGNWHARASEGSACPAALPVQTLWVFVDLFPGHRTSYVAPDEWVRRDIAFAQASIIVSWCQGSSLSFPAVGAAVLCALSSPTVVPARPRRDDPGFGRRGSA